MNAEHYGRAGANPRSRNEIHCYVANFKKIQPYLVISGAYEPQKAPSAAHMLLVIYMYNIPRIIIQYQKNTFIAQ